MIAPAAVRKSIRTRLLILFLGLITLTVVLISVLGVVNIFSAGRNAERVGNVTLRAQAEEYLVNLTEVTAENHDLEFQRTRHDIAYLAEYASNIFSHPEQFNPTTYWRVEDRMTMDQDGLYYSKPGDVGSSLAQPPSLGGSKEPTEVLEQLALLDVMFVPIYESHPNALLVYMVTNVGISRNYPFLDHSGDPLGANNVPIEAVMGMPFFANAGPEKNPARDVVWSPVYEELLDLGVVMGASGPVYTDQGDFMGVVGLDLSLEALMEEIERASPIAGGYSFLMNESGRLIALSDTGYRDVLGRSRGPAEVGPDIGEIVAPFAPVGTAMHHGDTGYQSIVVDDRELSVAYAPLLSTGWSLAHVVETDALLQVLRDLEAELDSSTQSLIFTRVLPVGGVILFVALALGLWLTGRLVNPLRRLTLEARQIGEGQWDEAFAPARETDIAASRGDEVGDLARSFQDMTAQLRTAFVELQASNTALRSTQEDLRETNEVLEQRVIARTQEMAAFFDVTMLTSESHNMSDLLGPALTRILDVGRCDAACIHLQDHQQNTLVLVSHQGLSSDELAKMQSIAIRDGLLDNAGGMSDPILTSDPQGSDGIPVELKPGRFVTYMGAQLRARGSAQGLLSCFRKSRERFSTNEVSLIVAVAEQLGVAIENHRLYQSTRTVAVLEERERLAREMHDSVTQSLYGINLFARSGREAAQDGDIGKLEESLTQLEEHSLTALQEMRLSLFQLHPSAVEDEGLVAALESRLDAVERRLGVASELQVDSEIDLPVEVEEELYHIVIEALNNVMRHAEASAVVVRLSSEANQVTLEVVDNGRGFDTAAESSGMGLRNMRARAEVLRGDLDIQSKPGEGTRLRVSVESRIEGRPL